MAMCGQPTPGFYAKETEALEEKGALSSDGSKNLPESPPAKLRGVTPTSGIQLPENRGGVCLFAQEWPAQGS